MLTCTLTRTLRSGPHHYGSKNRKHHLKNEERHRGGVGSSNARGARQSFAFALPPSIQTRDWSDSRAISERHQAGEGGKDVAHDVSQYQADLEAGWNCIKRSLRTRFSPEIRHHTDHLPPNDQTQTTAHALVVIV